MFLLVTHVTGSGAKSAGIKVRRASFASVAARRFRWMGRRGGGGGAPKSPEPCHTPGVSSPAMDRAEETDAASECSEDRIDLVQAEILAARGDVLRMRAVLRGLDAAQQLRAQVC